MNKAGLACDRLLYPVVWSKVYVATPLAHT